MNFILHARHYLILIIAIPGPYDAFNQKFVGKDINSVNIGDIDNIRRAQEVVMIRRQRRSGIERTDYRIFVKLSVTEKSQYERMYPYISSSDDFKNIISKTHELTKFCNACKVPVRYTMYFYLTLFFSNNALD